MISDVLGSPFPSSVDTSNQPLDNGLSMGLLISTPFYEDYGVLLGFQYYGLKAGSAHFYVYCCYK